MAAAVVTASTLAPWLSRALQAQHRRPLSPCRARHRHDEEEEEEEEVDEDKQQQQQQQEEEVRMEVSSSVMRMFQSGGERRPGEGLIEANQRKRNKKVEADKHTVASAAATTTLGFVRDELFGKSDIYVPRHDNLFPLLVATFATAYSDYDEEEDYQVDGSSDDDARFSLSSGSSKRSNLSRLKAAVEQDVAQFKSRSLMASGMFRDLNGEPLNSEASTDIELERWFLLSMYVKFKLWWKGPSTAAETALEYAYRMSNLVVDADGELGRVFQKVTGSLPCTRLATRYGTLCFLSLDNKLDAAGLQRRLQRELDETKRGWAAFILKAGEQEVSCLIAHCTSLIFFHLPDADAAAISYFMLAWAAATATNVTLLPSPSLWQCVPPLGLLAVVTGGTLLRRAVASLYGVQWAMTPLFVLPVPQVGAIPTFVYYRGCLPNRSCLFDISASTSVLQLALSGVLIAAGACVSVTNVVVPYRAFAHSGLLTWLLHELSSVWSWEGDEARVSMSPLVLGGLLGLNFTLLSLLPCGISDGGRMLTACLGRRVSGYISGFGLILGSVSLLAGGNAMLGILWTISCASMPEDSFQMDEVSDPGLARKTVAVVLLVIALVSLLPNPIPLSTLGVEQHLDVGPVDNDTRDIFKKACWWWCVEEAPHPEGCGWSRLGSRWQASVRTGP